MNTYMIIPKDHDTEKKKNKTLLKPKRGILQFPGYNRSMNSLLEVSHPRLMVLCPRLGKTHLISQRTLMNTISVSILMSPKYYSFCSYLAIQ